MNLASNGIDIFYVDESERYPLSVTTVVRVPFLRPSENGWKFVWHSYLEKAAVWRRALSKKHSIRFREELHGHKLMRTQGLYHKDWRNLSPLEATAAYSDALSTLTWLPDASIMSTYSTDQSELMGFKGIDACLLGLFQRLRTQCDKNGVNGLLFFDEGHKSYIKNYRRAQKWMPTGSQVGWWERGKATKNMPLDMFPKDANTKSSELSYFLQIADLVAYAARVKLENERGNLQKKRIEREHHKVYDAMPKTVINLRVTTRRADGIAPI